MWEGAQSFTAASVGVYTWQQWLSNFALRGCRTAAEEPLKLQSDRTTKNINVGISKKSYDPVN